MAEVGIVLKILRASEVGQFSDKKRKISLSTQFGEKFFVSIQGIKKIKFVLCFYATFA